MDATTLAALGVGGGGGCCMRRTMLRYMPSYDAGWCHVAEAPKLLPNVVPTAVSLLDSLSHVEGVHLGHLLIEKRKWKML